MVHLVHSPWSFKNVRRAILLAAALTASAAEPPVIHYRHHEVRGTRVFYREAGPLTAPVVVLLHGFPTSSHMFRNLLPQLAGEYRVLAPDLPGFGHSDLPPGKTMEHSFAGLTDVTEAWLDSLKITSFFLYVTDYGAPVGFRLALRRPDQIRGWIVQNGNLYEEGLGTFWDPARDYWRHPRTPETDRIYLAARQQHGPKWEYLHGVADPSKVSPDNWTLDLRGFERPGHKEFRLRLAHDYQTNVRQYPEYQQYFRQRQPPVLVVWGERDQIFTAAGARAFRRDVPAAEVHLFDAGHFALETHLHPIAIRIREFLARTLRKQGEEPVRRP